MLTLIRENLTHVIIIVGIVLTQVSALRADFYSSPVSAHSKCLFITYVA